jgi:hypothetical protein
MTTTREIAERVHNILYRTTSDQGDDIVVHSMEEGCRHAYGAPPIPQFEIEKDGERFVVLVVRSERR